MHWLELSVQVPFEFVEPVSYLFSRYGRGLCVEDVGSGQAILRTYLTSRSKVRRARIEVGIKLIGRIKPIKGLEVRGLDEIDWEEAWKEHFSLLKVGHSLVIKPPWIAYTGREWEHVIELDPGLAFGTGHHPTTFMCLEILEGLVRPGTRMLDFGVGSGILTIAAAKLGAQAIVALDVDATAVKVARKALSHNELNGDVKVARGTLPHGLVLENSFDLCVTNISAKVAGDRAAFLGGCLKLGGVLIVSGFLIEQEDHVLNRLTEVGLSCCDRRNIEDWVTLVFTRER